VRTRHHCRHEDERRPHQLAVDTWREGVEGGPAGEEGNRVAPKRRRYKARCAYGRQLCVYWELHNYGIKSDCSLGPSLTKR
jgi:hypothetical protein